MSAQAMKEDATKDYYEIILEKNHIADSTFLLAFHSSWTSENSKLLEAQKITIEKALKEESYTHILVDCKNLQQWDTYLLSFLVFIGHEAFYKKINFSWQNLPEDLEKLLQLALTVPPSSLAEKNVHSDDRTFVEMIGESILYIPEKSSEAIQFVSDSFKSFLRIFKGKTQMYGQDLWNAIFECGANSLAIISLTSLLLGLILAFVGSIQLKLFGAEVYVASFVGVSMVRIMGALLTGIVVAGRTGANFAAIIGTMQVNEEIDALQTFGISRIDFLVLPRVLALTLMTPLLTLYANLMGMFGGFIVGIVMLDIPTSIYISNTLQYMKLKYLWVGLFHAFVFGIVISLTGCYQGIKCGRSAEAVGKATTSAVVVSIVGIIIATSIITVIFTYLGW